RRHTRSKRDWSSDVCSSDLDLFIGDLGHQAASFEFVVEFHLVFTSLGLCGQRKQKTPSANRIGRGRENRGTTSVCRPLTGTASQIGRASCRERVTISDVAGS